MFPNTGALPDQNHQHLHRVCEGGGGRRISLMPPKKDILTRAINRFCIRLFVIVGLGLLIFALVQLEGIGGLYLNDI